MQDSWLVTGTRILGASMLGNRPQVSVSTGKGGHVRSPKSPRYPVMAERPFPAAAPAWQIKSTLKETLTGVLLICSVGTAEGSPQLRAWQINISWMIFLLFGCERTLGSIQWVSLSVVQWKCSWIVLCPQSADVVKCNIKYSSVIQWHKALWA